MRMIRYAVQTQETNKNHMFLWVDNCFLKAQEMYYCECQNYNIVHRVKWEHLSTSYLRCVQNDCMVPRIRNKSIPASFFSCNHGKVCFQEKQKTLIFWRHLFPLLRSLSLWLFTHLEGNTADRVSPVLLVLWCVWAV